MTTEQAIALADSGFWKSMTAREIATLQLYEPKLCMPFAVFQEAVEKTLGRPVWTHEFANAERLQTELTGDRPAPTMDQIIDMIPAEKRIVVGV